MTSYIGPNYEPAGPVTAFHGVPRFGNTDDITELFDADGTIRIVSLQYYILGTIFIASFLLAVYILFLCLIFIFKCCCRGDKSRVLAGLPFIDVVYEDKDTNANGSKALKFLRGTLLLCTSVIIVSGFVFLINGTLRFQAVADDVADVTEGFIELSKTVTSSADSFIAFSDDSVELRNALKNLVGDGICNSFEDGNSKPLDDFDNAANAMIQTLDGLQEFAKTEIVDIRDTFGANLESRVNAVEDVFDQYQRILNPAFYAGPAIALGAIFMIGIILAWMKFELSLYFCVQTWILLPIFYGFITISAFVIASIGVALVANADICIGNPSNTPEGLVDFLSKQFLDEPTQAAVDYYLVTGCRGQYVQLFGVEDILTDLPEATQQVADLNTLLKENKEDFENVCGGEEGSLDTLEKTFDDSLKALSEIQEIGTNATNLLSCEPINKIWVDLMHNAVCTSSPYALSYMFGTMTAIYIVGMVIFLCRGALLPEVVELEIQEDEVALFADQEGEDNFEPQSQAETPQYMVKEDRALSDNDSEKSK